MGVLPLLHCFHRSFSQDRVAPQQLGALDIAIRRNHGLNPDRSSDVEPLQSFGILRRNMGDDFSFFRGLRARWRNPQGANQDWHEKDGKRDGEPTSLNCGKRVDLEGAGIPSIGSHSGMLAKENHRGIHKRELPITVVTGRSSPTDSFSPSRFCIISYEIKHLKFHFPYPAKMGAAVSSLFSIEYVNFLSPNFGTWFAL